MKLYEYIILGMCICSQTKSNYTLLEDPLMGHYLFFS